MEIYRQSLGPNIKCHSYKYLAQLFAIAQPPTEIYNLRIRDLQRREESLFYAKDDVIGIFGNEEVLRDILKCRCDVCKEHLKMTDTDQHEMLGSIISKKRPKVVLLAILVYLGTSFVVRYVSGIDTIHDAALAMSIMTFEDKVWADIFEARLISGKLTAEVEKKRSTFLDNYDFVMNMFNAPLFSTADSWMSDYTENRRLPFLDDEEHSAGFFGEVRKFNIHENYLDVEGHYRQQAWYSQDRKHRFARKILRAKMTDKRDVTLEKTALQKVRAQNHPNIVELLFVYQWRDQYCFVFPFIERDLNTVLHGNWSPKGKSLSELPMRQNWLWRQIVEVASALQCIHNPLKPSPGSPVGATLIGFHFDLKPANILVTNEGVLKITDFGQALFKYTGPGDATYGIPRGGSPVYQPPDASPTISRRYDVWSLACIMLEVMVLILQGSDALLAFEKERLTESCGAAFHTSGRNGSVLKSCVQSRLNALRTCSNHSPADAQYLENATELLLRMFILEESNRPSSDVVHTELRRMSRSLPNGQITINVSNRSAKYPPAPGFREICIPNYPLRSFLALENVDYKSTALTSDWRPCHIKVLVNEEQRMLRLQVFDSEEDRENEYSLKQLQFSPLYLFDRNEIPRPSCELLNGGRSLWFSFETLNDILLFQTTMLEHSVVPHSDFRLKTISMLRAGVRDPDVLQLGEIKIQLWSYYRRQDNSPQNSTSSNTRSTFSRIMIFVKEGNRILNIPVYNQSTRLKGGEAAESQTHSITIVPNLAQHHRDFTMSDSSNASTQRYPSLPTSRHGFEKIETTMMKSVQLEFRSSKEKEEFTKILKAHTNLVFERRK